jgi:Flp pilus assembly pilin Flp
MMVATGINTGRLAGSPVLTTYRHRVPRECGKRRFVMKVLVRRFLLGESGQDLVEYALLLTLLAVGSVAYMSQSGSSMTTVWNTANLTLQGQAVSISQGSGSGTGTGTTGSSGTSGTTGTTVSAGSGSSGLGSSGGDGDGDHHHHDGDDH